MKTVKIRRMQTPGGTFGILSVDDVPQCLTLERPWKRNEANVSCIPYGAYVCKRVDSPKYGDTFGVMNVPERTHILFHSGNTIADSKGCILFGSNIGIIGGVSAVFSSGYARDDFMELMNGVDEFNIEIT